MTSAGVEAVSGDSAGAELLKQSGARLVNQLHRVVDGCADETLSGVARDAAELLTQLMEYHEALESRSRAAELEAEALRVKVDNLELSNSEKIQHWKTKYEEAVNELEALEERYEEKLLANNEKTNRMDSLNNSQIMWDAGELEAKNQELQGELEQLRIDFSAQQFKGDKLRQELAAFEDERAANEKLWQEKEAELRSEIGTLRTQLADETRKFLDSEQKHQAFVKDTEELVKRQKQAEQLNADSVRILQQVQDKCNFLQKSASILTMSNYDSESRIRDALVHLSEYVAASKDQADWLQRQLDEVTASSAARIAALERELEALRLQGVAAASGPAPSELRAALRAELEAFAQQLQSAAAPQVVHQHHHDHSHDHKHYHIHNHTYGALPAAESAPAGIQDDAKHVEDVFLQNRITITSAKHLTDSTVSRAKISLQSPQTPDTAAPAPDCCHPAETAHEDATQTCAQEVAPSYQDCHTP